MKIVIPTNNGVTIAERTGQARGYMIYFLTNGKIDRQIHKILPDHMSHNHHEGGNNHSHKDLVSFLWITIYPWLRNWGPYAGRSSKRRFAILDSRKRIPG